MLFLEKLATEAEYTASHGDSLTIVRVTKTKRKTSNCGVVG